MTRQPGEDVGVVTQEVARLLGELGMRAFVFTLEPKEGLWQLRVECALDGDWQVVTIPLERAALFAALHDPSERERLKADLRHRLRACGERDMP